MESRYQFLNVQNHLRVTYFQFEECSLSLMSCSCYKCGRLQQILALKHFQWTGKTHFVNCDMLFNTGQILCSLKCALWTAGCSHVLAVWFP